MKYFAALSACLMLAWLPPSNAAQQSAQPATPRLRFEVASVKNADPVGVAKGGYTQFTGGRAHIESALVNIIFRTYGLASVNQITGPDWIRTERFAIEAKAPGPATEDQVRMMMQALLADRFRLEVRHEKKETPGYALVVAKGGAKLAAATFGPDGKWGNSQGSTMAAWATLLSRLAGAPVIDATGISGTYVLSLPSIAPGPDAVDTASSALTESCGLALEPRKLSLDTLVITHVERPDPDQ